MSLSDLSSYMMNVEDESSASSSSSSFDAVTQNPSSPAHDKPTASHKRKAGRKKFRETRHPVYRGVRQRNLNRWVCEMREPNKNSRIWVGTFNSPEMAARAHDVAVIALGGDTAKLNFSNSVEVLPRPNSSSVRDIQIAALEATRVLTSQMPSSSTPSPPPLNHSRNKFQTNLQKPLTECQSSSHDLVDSTVATDSSATVFLDEEALFNMPGLIASMAEGLLLTPPALKRGFNWDDMGKCDMDLTLWKP